MKSILDWEITQAWIKNATTLQVKHSIPKKKLLNNIYIYFFYRNDINPGV